ncbi:MULTISPECIES: carbohydrate ABC transporter permease [unclassified Thalassospira]|jgi:raffinose/stachyose/melibiose transport system permease protein|uniref:carbohydrate ABC transporter permease n=1 Tax=unclassified Thalassospira TaxID=2648997 RepID=UPI000A1EFEAE|nr:carbohydrate ABC transporter permease [Thalassospira sp. MCCC 1A01428]OSQ41242.1 sugar ABC transporter permease [Thalassospira sp. MCCC 1A01428]
MALNVRKDHASRAVIVHAVLLSYTLIALYPVFLIVINAFKSRKGIFREPMALPTTQTFSLSGFEKVLDKADFGTYFFNSISVTVVTIVVVLLLAAMAAWALSEYKFPLNTALAIYLAIGIMVPIRLGTVSILSLMVDLGLVNTLTSLVLVYVAQGLPLAIFILTEFMHQIPKDLKEAARCDGVGEFKIFFAIILPLVRPAVATVAVFTMIPIWNDLWFPLILAPGDGKQTITLGVQQFIGQYVTDWNAVLASLSLAIIPILILYLIFSRQLIRGLTSGAVK